MQNLLLTLLYIIIAGMNMLKPVLTKYCVKSFEDVEVGDHMYTVHKSQPSHYLVHTKNSELKKIEVFTTKDKLVVAKSEINAQQEISKKKLYRIKYYPCGSTATDKTIERAENELKKNSKWQRSDQFVTMMKCGTAHIIDDRCLMSEEASLVIGGSTKLTSMTSLDEGDHLVIQDMKNPDTYHSVLVCSFLNQASVVIIPPNMIQRVNIVQNRLILLVLS